MSSPLPPQAVICLHALLNMCTANTAALRLYVPLLKNLCLYKNDFSRISCNLTFFSTVSPAKLTRSSGQNNDIMYMQVTCGTCEAGSTGHQQFCARTSASIWSSQTSASSLMQHSLMQFLGR